ncbi:MAG: RluA family pseudouridine synthase [Chitinispirillales bacterium]|jgi:23S rRNA pseudouridine955/2504/2580 synthase|nr:RluA family pseudouridine synthase [Chitinispirillales bacterium]
MIKIIVSENDGGKRIDRLVREELNCCSLGEIFRLFRTRRVSINGIKCKESERVKFGDEILIFADKDELKNKSAQKIKIINKNNFQLIYEDKNLIVCNKLSGVASQPGKGIPSGTSLIELARNYADEKFVPYLIHRIDADTSGVILIAKDIDFLRSLQNIWNSEFVKKEYVAVCFGNFDQKNGKIDLKLERTSKEAAGMKMKVTEHGGLRSISQYKIISQNENCAIVSVEINTGRTHQIRTHFAYINHCLLGDKRYGNNQADKAIEEKSGLKINRLMLHSHKISFFLNKKQYSFSAQIPDIFHKFIK